MSIILWPWFGRIMISVAKIMVIVWVTMFENFQKFEVPSAEKFEIENTSIRDSFAFCF